MKKVLAVIVFTLFLCHSGMLAQGQPPEAAPALADQLMVAFITINGYGNNLYIDNISVGEQYTDDIAILGITNIAKDTTYAIGSSPLSVAPKVAVLNAGKTGIASPFNVTMVASPGGYSSTKAVSSINAGQMQEVVFDNLVINPSTPLNITVTCAYAVDQNRLNDTLRHYMLMLPGTRRTVLFEEATNASCSPCATNNPYLDAFVAARFDTIVAIKYHAWWPGSGDPMYVANTTENANRIDYYGINGVPTLKIDGVKSPYPFNPPSLLQDPYAQRLNTGAPMSISVTDTKIAGDSIVADVSISILSVLRAGDYKLRVCAVERKIHYASPPGSNGETDFYDVFRKFYPDAVGTTLPTAVGNYAFQFRYKRSTAWVDSLLYTAVFVQDDRTKEVMNCAKARHFALSETPAPAAAVAGSGLLNGKPIQRLPDNLLFEQAGGYNQPRETMSGFNFEVFEGAFPPPGWRIGNPDLGITFAHFEGANGPSFGGLRSVTMEFYSYGTTGQRDTLRSPVFSGLSPTDSLKFDWAYRRYSTAYNDRMIVKLSTDGGATFPFTAFDKDANTMPTVPGDYGYPFIPASSSEWGRFRMSLTGIVTAAPEESSKPIRFELLQNYPNPFNPSTTITYTLATPSRISLGIYDLLGRRVASLFEGTKPAGTFAVEFDGSQHASGIYICKLLAGAYSSSVKMLLMK